MKIIKKEILAFVVVASILSVNSKIYADEISDPHSSQAVSTEETCSNGNEVVYDELENFPIEEEEVLFIDNQHEDFQYFNKARPLSSSPKVGDYFYSVSWIKRNGKWSLSLNPKNNLRYTPHSKTTTAHLAWGVLWRNYAGDKRWNYKNKTSMQHQFRCHISNAKAKSRWNIEPWKSSSNPITCN